MVLNLVNGTSVTLAPAKGIIISRNSAKEIWPSVLKWIEKNER